MWFDHSKDTIDASVFRGLVQPFQGVSFSYIPGCLTDVCLHKIWLHFTWSGTPVTLLCCPSRHVHTDKTWEDLKAVWLQTSGQCNLLISRGGTCCLKYCSDFKAPPLQLVWSCHFLFMPFHELLSSSCWIFFYGLKCIWVLFILIFWRPAVPL